MRSASLLLASFVFLGAGCAAERNVSPTSSRSEKVSILRSKDWSEIYVNGELAGAIRSEIGEYRLSEDHEKLLFLDKEENLYVWNEKNILRVGEGVEYFAWNETGKSFVYSSHGDWFFRDWNASGTLSHEQKKSLEEIEDRYNKDA